MGLTQYPKKFSFNLAVLVSKSHPTQREDGIGVLKAKKMKKKKKNPTHLWRKENCSSDMYKHDYRKGEVVTYCKFIYCK